MARFAGATFTMGEDVVSPDRELDWSTPSHAASVPPFELDVTEVTVGAYRRCFDAGVCSTPGNEPRASAWPTCNWGVDGRDDYPINCVTWRQADAYCRWAKKELPTEEMWEYAARGKSGRTFPWGNKVDGMRWGAPPDVYERLEGRCRTPDHRSDYDTCPVGSAPLGATPEGVLDLAGNVSEWTDSPSCTYGKKNSCDDEYRVHRGGGNNYSSYPQEIWAAFRASGKKDYFTAAIGFRCARRSAQ